MTFLKLPNTEIHNKLHLDYQGYDQNYVSVIHELRVKATEVSHYAACHVIFCVHYISARSKTIAAAMVF